MREGQEAVNSKGSGEASKPGSRPWASSLPFIKHDVWCLAPVHHPGDMSQVLPVTGLGGLSVAPRNVGPGGFFWAPAYNRQAEGLLAGAAPTGVPVQAPGSRSCAEHSLPFPCRSPSSAQRKARPVTTVTTETVLGPLGGC